MFDLISIGDATIDTYIQIHEASIKCDIDKKDCKICVNYGDKIPVDTLTHIVAGNAANNAVGAKRLGLKTAIYTNVGGDPEGKKILEQLKSEGVDKRYIVVHSEMESNFSAVLGFQGERTIFVYHQPWKYQLPDLESARWLYYTSVSASAENSDLTQEVIRYIQRTGTKLFFNPGTHQLKSGVKKTPQLLALTEVFIVNLHEAKMILEYKDTDKVTVEKLLRQLSDLGPKSVIITDGAQGSYAYDGEKSYHLPVFPAKLVEMTGAGDSYATGVLAGLVHKMSLADAMRWGAANSASVVEFVGPQQGLLTYEQMQKTLKENSKIVAKEI